MAPPPPSAIRLPRLYTLFFLTLSPLASLTHAVLTYLSATTPTLHQLASLLLLRALTEALVLRATADRSVWRALLFCLLVADLGHLATLRHALGAAGYVSFWAWSAADWGGVGFVYVAVVLRGAFLGGVGMGIAAAATAGKGAKAGKGGAAVAQTTAAGKTGAEIKDEKAV